MPASPAVPPAPEPDTTAPADDRVVLFTINDVPYTVPKQPDRKSVV